MLGVCDRCRSPLDVAINTGKRGGPEASTHLGDSYVVLPERRRSALPDLSQTVGPGHASMLPAASMHEQLRTVSRLLELSDLMHDKAPRAGCGVPLCDDCASSVLHELQRRLEEAHAERERLHTASAELLAGEDLDDFEEDDDDDAVARAPAADAAAPTSSGKSARREEPLSPEDFAREREAQREEEARLRAALAAATAERAGLADELARLNEEWTAQKAAEETRHSAINRASYARQEAAEEAMRAVQLVAVCEGEVRAAHTPTHAVLTRCAHMPHTTRRAAFPHL